MAQGQLLAEGTSEDLRARFRSHEMPNPTMEDAFVALVSGSGNSRAGSAA